jgi:hypothetical protein
MVYTSDWEPLADALRRVMATSPSEAEAKIDLCRAVADRKINVRVKIAASDRDRPGQVFSDGNVGVPAHLKPDDLNWAKSCPFAQWAIGPTPPENYTWIGGWKNRPLALIEVSTADVIAILCGGANKNDKSAAIVAQETAAIKALASHLESNPQLTRAEARAWCETSDYRLNGRGFQYRVWPKARELANLPATASPGRKGKSSR